VEVRLAPADLIGSPRPNVWVSLVRPFERETGCSLPIQRCWAVLVDQALEEDGLSDVPE
jgi:hypothetical protein